MTQIELQPKEWANFIRLAQQSKEKYHYTIIGSIIFVSASISFLNDMGYLN